MIEPPKLAVFLFVVTAHLAVLAFGFPNLSPTSEASSGTAAAASPSPSAEVVVVEKSALNSSSSLGADADKPRYGAESDQDHADQGNDSHPAASPASASSSATRARHQPDPDGPVDTVPTLEEHRRQHGHSDDGHDHDSEPQLVDLERVAHHDAKPEVAEKLTPTPTELVVTPKSPGLKPLPASAEESRVEVSARPTPVQMITPEKPGATPAPSVTKPKLKPIVKPATTIKSPEPPRARPVPNAPKATEPTSNRAGSSRMKNLRPIKK